MEAVTFDASLHLFSPTEQRDDELSGPQEAIQSQPDDHHLHHPPLLPLLPRCLCVCHIHHVEVCTHTHIQNILVLWRFYDFFFLLLTHPNQKYSFSY